MPVSNIIDRRTNIYNVEVMVIFEDSWHDNDIEGGTKFEQIDKVDYIGIELTTIETAIKYAAQEWPNHYVTLYLYDVGTENYIDYNTIVIKNGIFTAVKLEDD